MTKRVMHGRAVDTAFAKAFNLLGKMGPRELRDKMEEMGYKPGTGLFKELLKSRGKSRFKDGGSVSSRKSFTQKKREERIQKQVEKLGGPKKTPKPKTLRQTAQKQLERARLIQQFPFSSTSKKEGTMMDLAGFKPATEKEAKTAFLKGTRGLYEENVPKELRDRIKFEKVQKKKDGGSVRPIIKVDKDGKIRQTGKKRLKDGTISVQPEGGIKFIPNKKGGGLMEAIEKVKAKEMKEGGNVPKPKMRPKKDPFRADKTVIINEDFSKAVAKANEEAMKKAKKMEEGGPVPAKFKGFSKLPEAVQEKMNPALAKKFGMGGSVKGKGSKMMCRGRGAAIKGGGFSIR